MGGEFNELRGILLETFDFIAVALKSRIVLWRHFASPQHDQRRQRRGWLELSELPHLQDEATPKPNLFS
jgi:hypothetical protein